MFDWVKEPDSIEIRLGDELGSPRRVAKHSRRGRILQFVVVLGTRLRIRAESSLQLYAPELLFILLRIKATSVQRLLAVDREGMRP